MRIGLIGNKFTTIDCLESLIRAGHAPAMVIVLPGNLAEKHQVAGRSDVSAAARRRNIDVYVTKSYALSDKSDRTAIQNAGLDLLVVIGWERLIPDPILSSIRFGSVGMHGSAFGLPRGRGRSPLNWSIIQGHDTFTTSLIRHDSGIDSGMILGNRTFKITQWDTIATLHFKNRIAMNELLNELIQTIEKGEIGYAKPQRDEKATYYPRRTPEDGAIDWRRTALEIHQFVRAQSRPYPGAFTFIDSRKVRIWNCAPDPGFGGINAPPGEVIDTSEIGMLLVGTGDGLLLITEYEFASHIAPPTLFESVDYRSQMKNVIARYPSWVEPHQREIDSD